MAIIFNALPLSLSDSGIENLAEAGVFISSMLAFAGKYSDYLIDLLIDTLEVAVEHDFLFALVLELVDFLATPRNALPRHGFSSCRSWSCRNTWWS